MSQTQILSPASAEAREKFGLVERVGPRVVVECDGIRGQSVGRSVGEAKLREHCTVAGSVSGAEGIGLSIWPVRRGSTSLRTRRGGLAHGESERRKLTIGAKRRIQGESEKVTGRRTGRCELVGNGRRRGDRRCLGQEGKGRVRALDQGCPSFVNHRLDKSRSRLHRQRRGRDGRSALKDDATLRAHDRSNGVGLKDVSFSSGNAPCLNWQGQACGGEVGIIEDVSGGLVSCEENVKADTIVTEKRHRMNIVQKSGREMQKCHQHQADGHLEESGPRRNHCGSQGIG
jgi:hypothetical protein